MNNKQFKYIRSNEKDVKGKALYSGQDILLTDANGKTKKSKITFTIEDGFSMLIGDFQVLSIERLNGTNIFKRIYGAIRFGLFNITGK